MTAEQYPTANGQAGPNLGYAYDTMGRLNTLTDLTAQSSIISGTTYGPSNELLTMSGLVTETRTYNSMLQLLSLVASASAGPTVNLTYAYSSTQNNGKLTSQTDNISGEQVVYTYDALNRLASAAATSNSWGQSFSYDGFGNLTGQTVTAGSAPSYSVTPDPSTNHLGGEDANGNTPYSNDANGTNYVMTYDVENRYTGSLTSTGLFMYGYAPGNKRVYRGVENGNNLVTDEVTYWSPTGQKLATYGMVLNGSQYVAVQTGAYYWFGGKLIRNATGYVTADRLGSIGKFYPYGLEKPSATTNGTEKFTGYLRDAETGLDYAKNRYHDPGTGRFMTPDPYWGSADAFNPVSWNRYVYVFGDPINGTDPLGLITWSLVARGATQIILGGAAFASGAVTLAGTAVTGLGAVIGVLGIASGAGAVAVGVSSVIAGFTSDSGTALASQYSAGLSTVTTLANPLGLAATAVTGGNLQAGAAAAAASSVASGTSSVLRAATGQVTTSVAAAGAFSSVSRGFTNLPTLIDAVVNSFSNLVGTSVPPSTGNTGPVYDPTPTAVEIDDTTNMIELVPAPIGSTLSVIIGGAGIDPSAEPDSD